MSARAPPPPKEKKKKKKKKKKKVGLTTWNSAAAGCDAARRPGWNTSSAPAEAAEPRHAPGILNRSCVTCHNARLKTAGPEQPGSCPGAR